MARRKRKKIKIKLKPGTKMGHTITAIGPGGKKTVVSRGSSVSEDMYDLLESKALAAHIAAHVKELNTDSVVSRSHLTLRRGRKKWGEKIYDAALAAALKEK